MPVATEDGGVAPPTISMLLCGGDLLASFPIVKDDGELLWATEDQVPAAAATAAAARVPRTGHG